MAFELQSDIKIGDFRFSGVHEIRIKNSLHGCGVSATIILPSIAYVKGNKSEPERVITNTQFKYGDKVVINLGYNGVLREEFVGFVKRPGIGMPMVLECEGYEQLLRDKVAISGDYRKTATSAKKLLEMATAGTGIKVQCPVDFPLIGIKLTKANGLQVISYIKEASDRTLTIFFIKPDTLWCGLTYTPYANQTKTSANMFGLPVVSYRLGWNCPKDNGLKERIPTERVQVIYSGKLADSTVIHNTSKDKKATRKLKSLRNHVPDEKTLGHFAQEKAYSMNYSGYEGHITGLLQPYCQVGYDVYLEDDRDAAINGIYLADSVQVTFGMTGARRIIELGPRVGFDKKQN